jgi:teichuronic acid biosynthesis glycosyltransferase TuaG
VTIQISVITPLYQGAGHIEQCIRSVAAQSRSDIEHIIIDNNSTDQGPEIVASFKEIYPHIKLITCAKPGPAPARNCGIEEASGKYIAFLDADDWWADDKANVQINAMQTAEAAFSWSAYDIMDSEGNQIRTQNAPARMTARRHALKLGTIGCLTAVYDSDLIGKQYMNEDGLREDFCLWFDILSITDSKNLPTLGIQDPLAYYRIHQTNSSSNKKSAAIVQWRTYREHMRLGRMSTAAHFASYAINAVLDRIRT